jgi:hypothetical protein
MLWTDPELNDYTSFSSFLAPGGPEHQFRVPFKYNLELPANSWRLAIVTEEELKKGEVEWEP